MKKLVLIFILLIGFISQAQQPKVDKIRFIGITEATMNLLVVPVGEFWEVTLDTGIKRQWDGDSWEALGSVDLSNYTTLNGTETLTGEKSFDKQINLLPINSVSARAGYNSTYFLANNLFGLSKLGSTISLGVDYNTITTSRVITMPDADVNLGLVNSALQPADISNTDTTANILLKNPTSFLGQTWFSADEKCSYKAVTLASSGLDIWKSSCLTYDESKDTYKLPTTQDGQTQDIGQEVFVPVYNDNSSGATELNPKLFITVGVKPGEENIKSVIKASRNDIYHGAVYGVNTTSLSVGEYGKLLVYGDLNGINTSAWLEGSILYIDLVSGELTDVKPSTQIFPVGIVTKSHATDGKLFINTISSPEGETTVIPAGFDRIHYTGDEVVLATGTYFLGKRNDTGTVPTATSTAVCPDNTIVDIAQSTIGGVLGFPITFPAGLYTGQIEFQVNGTSGEQRIYIEYYKAANDGTPIDSGILTEAVGTLGVRPALRVVSALYDAPSNTPTHASFQGSLSEDLTIGSTERIRTVIMCEKVGSAGGDVTFTVYFGNLQASFVDAPTPFEISDNIDVDTSGSVTNDFLKKNGSGIWQGSIIEISDVNTLQTQIDGINDGKADKSNVLGLDNTSAYTPTANYHPVTKLYSDSKTLGQLSNVTLSGLPYTGTHILKLKDDDVTWENVDLETLGASFGWNTDLSNYATLSGNNVFSGLTNTMKGLILNNTVAGATLNVSYNGVQKIVLGVDGGDAPLIQGSGNAMRITGLANAVNPTDALPLGQANSLYAPIGSSTDDQTSTEVPFTPYLTITSTNTQAATQELKDELDTATNPLITPIDATDGRTFLITDYQGNNILRNNGNGSVYLDIPEDATLDYPDNSMLLFENIDKDTDSIVVSYPTTGGTVYVKNEGLKDGELFRVTKLSADNWYAAKEYTSATAPASYGAELIDVSTLSASEGTITYSGGVWVFASASRYSTLTKIGLFTTGVTYKVEITGANYVSGNFRLLGPATTSNVSSNGVHVFEVVATNGNFQISPNSDSENTYDITSISVKEKL